MPIITKPVEPWVNPPYRGKIVEASGLRNFNNWSDVKIHFRSTYNHAHLVVHAGSSHDHIILEVHDAGDENGDEEEFCRMEAFHLNPQQRYDLAIYLLSTVNVR